MEESELIMNYTFQWFNKDIRKEIANIHYLLSKVCKKNSDGFYSTIDFISLKWMIDRINFDMSDKFGIDFFPNNMFHYFCSDDNEFNPDMFVCDWGANYKMKNGHLVFKKGSVEPEEYKEKGLNRIYKDYLSQAVIESVDRIVTRWKLYGRITSAINYFVYLNIIYPIKKKFNRK